MTIDYRRIGLRIKDARKQKNMTQEGLAELLDVSVGYVSQVERGVTKISLDLLGELSAILGKELSYFTEETGTESPSYMLSELAAQIRLLSEENRRILETTVQAMLREQDHK